MTNASTSSTPNASDAPANATNPPPPWKPERHRWTWKDLLTAPMLAFKPTCMVVSALMLLAFGGLAAWFDHLSPSLGGWWWPVWSAFILVGLVIYGIGATLITTYMKADALDDEFLSLKEAVQQWLPRLRSAVIVPLFLVVLVVGVHGLMIWLPMFIASIPYVGSALYALLYPFGVIAAIFAILLLLVALLGLFVFPAVIAVRKHGWFDHVVDTIEAVGTRPHIIIASLVLSGVLMLVAFGIGMGAMGYLHGAARAQPRWSQQQELSEPARAEWRAIGISSEALSWFWGPTYGVSLPLSKASANDEPYYKWGTGLLLGSWQTLIGALILGYCLNLFIAGGTLAYLLVREDDYWDDENLEDLDKLAKELEEEAKREEQGLPSPTTAAATAPSTPPAAGGTPPTA
ncbi:MAG: hypothetical protein N3B15_08440 [Planctomycetota bacterium]|nr:hypothetical protein [Planctomycetota bacterium]